MHKGLHLLQIQSIVIANSTKFSINCMRRLLGYSNEARRLQLRLAAVNTCKGRVMGVPISLKRSTSYDFSFASFSTTGTLQSSVAEADTMTATIETVVAQLDDLQDGQMKTVDVGEGKALLVREHGQYYAVGHKCTHYGAPLASGALLNGRVRCPWHGACFNVKTGDIEDFPGLDSIPKFEVVISGTNVIVKAYPEQFKSHKRVKAVPSNRNPALDKRKFVIIGGGGSAMKAAEALREEGFYGSIVMVTKETHLPYDRPLLSKKLAISAGDMKLRSNEYMKEHNIQFLLGKEAIFLDAKNKTVQLSDGNSLEYDSILIATGGQPRSLDIPGSKLKNILLLRSPEDANKIAEIGPGKKAVIIGSSFIGMEIAAFLSGKASSVTVVGRSEIPFANVLGKEIGGLLKKMHEDKGVRFISGQTAKEFKGQDGKLCAVVLTDGTELEADICVQGIGVKPSTNFLKHSGVPLNKQGCVVVDKYLQACDGVYAAGDIANFPLKMLDWEPVTIGHWQMSHKHGLTAARNMLGKNEKINTVPFFWTMQYGKSVRYCGHAHHFDDVIIDGSVAEFKFIAYYVKGDKVLAVATMGRDPVAAKAANLLFEGKMPSASQIRENPSEWLS